jgi:sugar phosphate isomerase/epimerase
MDRRNFLKVTGAAGLATVWGSSLACAHSTAAAGSANAALIPGGFSLSQVGLQLYTVRDAMAKDLDGTLAAVAAAGYKLVETAGMYGKSAGDLRAAFDKHGIRTVSGHYPLADLESAPETVFTTAKTLGQEWVTVPWLDPSLRTAETFGSLPGRLNKLGEAARTNGMKLAYHNHDFEFQNYGASTTVMERLLANTDPALVSFELDGYWAFKAGNAPADLVARYPNRFTLLHLKDSTAAPEKAFADVGKGVIDFRRFIAAAQRNGVKYAFVERDVAPDPIASIKASHDYLASVLPA